VAKRNSSSEKLHRRAMRSEWLRRFHGVASHYLPNYLGWRWAVDGGRIGSPEMLLRSALRAFPHLAVT
jgi:hypothetical protein